MWRPFPSLEQRRKMQTRTKTGEKKKVARWQCRVCGYIHEGEEPPETCPVCGAPKSEFERIS